MGATGSALTCCRSNEPTLEDKLREQLCHIALTYETECSLICGYIAIFEMYVANPNRPNLIGGVPDSLSPTPHHSNSYSSAHHHSNSHHHHHHSPNINNHHYHNSSHGSHSKNQQHEKKELRLMVELNYSEFNEWKIDELIKNNPNLNENELKQQSISQTFNILRSGREDEEKHLLQNGLNGDSTTNVHNQLNNLYDMKKMMKKNEMRSSVNSLGDRTDKLCDILYRAKVLHRLDGVGGGSDGKKIIHIRGNKQTVFSYYLLLNDFIVISYSQTKSDELELYEWIRIQSKLQKLQTRLIEIESLLAMAQEKKI